MTTPYQALKVIVNDFPAQARELVNEYTIACDVGDLTAMHAILGKLGVAAARAEMATLTMLAASK